MLEIDGSRGEGGGQILRTALALSACLGKPFRINRIRAARKNPGLQPQHRAAVQAAAAITRAEVEGDARDSQRLVFHPQAVVAGDYRFAIGTAGSTTLVLQTVLPALMLADAPSTLVLEGGTHNPFAPPFDFLQHAYLPLINRMGPVVSAKLERPGFAPRGGGRIQVLIKPVNKFQPLELLERGAIQRQYAEVVVAHLPEHIAQRELAVLKQLLVYPERDLSYRIDNKAYGPGNVVTVIVECTNITECFSAFGQRGLPAEDVAKQLAKEVQRYLAAGVPVGHHLADQLLLPLALAEGGSFISLKPSSHTLTVIDVIHAFIAVDIEAVPLNADVWKITLSSQ